MEYELHTKSFCESLIKKLQQYDFLDQLLKEMKMLLLATDLSSIGKRPIQLEELELTLFVTMLFHTATHQLNSIGV